MGEDNAPPLRQSGPGLALAATRDPALDFPLEGQRDAGEVLAEAGREDQTVATASFDLDAIAAQRRAWGIFRDRRPGLYGSLLTLDGQATSTT